MNSPAKVRFGLASRITVLAIANFALLGLVFAVYVRLQLRTDMTSFLMTAARERIIAISRQIVLDLQNTSGDDRTRLLQRYSSEHGVNFSLFLNSGEQLAGDPVTLPDDVLRRLRERPGPGAPGSPEDRPLPPPPRKDGGSAMLPLPRRPGSDPFLVETAGTPGYWVGVRMPVPDPHEPRPMRGTLLIASSSFWTNSFFFQLTPWLLMGGIASAISVLLWFPFVRGTTNAVHRMLAATSTISTGRFDVDAASGRRDELGQLGQSINRMAAQLDSLVQTQKRFLADAAHELRSPLGRMQLAAGILERKADEQEARYVADLKEDVEMMADLTDELLVYARAESLPATSIGPVAIGPLIEKALRMERCDGVEIRVDVTAGLFAAADETTLCRSLANIVRNSMRFAGHAGPILVSAAGANGEVVITISDSGPGVPEDSLGKIFTPFYRLDESRNRKTGGAGLGLAIVKSCMDACGGTIECRNLQPSGLETRLRLKKSGAKKLECKKVEDLT